MIGRLVEQQKVRFGKQDRRQRDAHPPAAGQIVERTALHRLVDAEPGEDACGPARRRMGLDLEEPRLDPAARRGPARRPVRRASGALGVRGKHGFQRVAAPLGASCARNPMRCPRGNSMVAAIRLQDPADQVEQGRFADAVASNQADLAAIRDLRARRVEQVSVRQCGRSRRQGSASEIFSTSAPRRAMNRAGIVRIGISSWTYRGWRGTFYPRGLWHSDELYASWQVHTIEINGTHYSLQRPNSSPAGMMKPPGFCLCRQGQPVHYPFEAASRYRDAARQFLRLRRLAAGGEIGPLSVAVLASFQV